MSNGERRIKCIREGDCPTLVQAKQKVEDALFLLSAVREAAFSIYRGASPHDICRQICVILQPGDNKKGGEQ